MRSCPLALAADGPGAPGAPAAAEHLGVPLAFGRDRRDRRGAARPGSRGAELEQLFAAQWSTGMVPHIVFRAGQGARYFPGPEWWDCAAVTPAARGLPAQTTGICQPPVHALAVRRIWHLTPPPLRPEIRAHPGAVPAAGALAPLPGHRA